MSGAFDREAVDVLMRLQRVVTRALDAAQVSAPLPADLPLALDAVRQLVVARTVVPS